MIEALIFCVLQVNPARLPATQRSQPAACERIMPDGRRDWSPQDELRYLEECRAAALAARGGPAEQAFRAAHGAAMEPVDVVKAHRHLLPTGPVGEKVDGSDWPMDESVGVVPTVVVVAARRQIARFLSFVDVEGARKEVRSIASRSSSSDSAAVAAAAAGSSSSPAAAVDEVRLQLVMGRHLRSHVQDDAATRKLLKSVRPGCVLGVCGYPQRNRGAPTDLDVLELICQVRKRVFGPHSTHLKRIILPRPARDKRRGNKKRPFLVRRLWSFCMSRLRGCLGCGRHRGA